jgi:hypothetical protein
MSYSEDRILRDVLKCVARHGGLSAIKAFLYAADRDFDITMLEKRLSDSRSSILVCRRDSYYEVIGHPENLANTVGGRFAGSKFILMPINLTPSSMFLQSQNINDIVVRTFRLVPWPPHVFDRR